MINLYLLITLFSNLESAKAPKFIKLKIEKHMLAGLRDAHACLAGIQAICFAVQPSHFSGILFGALRDIPFLFFCFYISNRFFYRHRILQSNRENSGNKVAVSLFLWGEQIFANLP